MLSGRSISRNARMPLEVPSAPASTFGQNQSVGQSAGHESRAASRSTCAPRQLVFGRDRMLHHDEVAVGQIEPRADARRIARTGRSRAPDSRRISAARSIGRTAGDEHRRRILTHANDALGGPVGGDQVQVGELGDGVAHLFVDRPGHLAALNMRDRDVHVGRRPRRSTASRSGPRR